MNNFETIIYAKKDSVASITLSGPKMLNSYNMQMRDELYEVLGAVRDDNEIKALIIIGAGEKAFCAGADLSEFLTAPSPIIARQVRWERDLWGLFLDIRQPVIAALHGFILGSGIEIALCCDIRLASEDAKFGLPEVRLGIIPAAGATQTLPRTIGRSRSLDMLLTGRWLNAEEALEARLINRIIPADQLRQTAEGLAATLASRSQTAIRSAKQAIRRGIDLTLAEGLEMEHRLALSILQSSPRGL